MKHRPAQLQKKLNLALVSSFAVVAFALHGGTTFAQTPPPGTDPPEFTQDATPTPTPEANVEPTESDEVGLTAIPTRIGGEEQLRLKPGEKRQISLKVRNNSTLSVKVTSLPLDMMVGEDGETPYPLTKVEAENNRWALASWITLSPNQHTLKPKELIELTALIEVPKDALPGGHYAMVVHQPVFGTATAIADQAATGVSQQTGTLVYVVVDGPINEEAFIRNVTFPQLSEYGPVPFSYDVENRSDVHIRPQTSVIITNMLGNTVGNIAVDSSNIFPFSTRHFAGEWDRTWGFGRYTATLQMSYGSQGSIVVSRATFWLLPLRLMLALLVLLLSLVVVVIAVRRHLIHRRQELERRNAQLEKRVHELEDSKNSS